MLELRNICFTRDNKKILDNVSLKIDNDKFIVITGPNGSGKSTLAKIIMGITKQDEGQVIFNGKDISDLSIDERAKLGIGFAFQQPVKFKGITVRDIINLSAGKEISTREIHKALSGVGLCPKEYIDREVNGSLSGGELKRIEIASVSIKKSKLTIFDEPEAGIDLWSFNNLIEVFENMREEVKGTSIIISHQERILNIADEIIVLSRGKIAKVGTRDEILPSVIQRRCPHKFNVKGDKNEQNR